MIKPHSNLIVSSIEFGIISAFWRLFWKVGIFNITIDRILYHNNEILVLVYCSLELVAA